MPNPNNSSNLSKSKKYKIVSTSARAHSAPRQDAKITASVSKGFIFSATAAKNGWLKVISADNGTSTKVTGSLSNSYISIKLGPIIQCAPYTNPSGSNAATTQATTTPTDTTSGDVSTVNTDDDGNTSVEVEGDPFYLDDDFTVSYMVSNPSSSDYRATLDGLKIQDMRGVLGMPHQFLPTADARVDGSTAGEGSIGSIGRVYADKIIKQIPLLLITPGTPYFMSSFSADQKQSVISNLLSPGASEADIDLLVNENSGKYYSLKFAYTEYFYYVNAMLRAAAHFLEIQNARLFGNETLGTYQWMNYSTDPDGQNEDMFGSSGLRKFLGPYGGCLAFYADCGKDVDDSFSNSTTQSNLSSSLNSLSDTGRELNFLIGNVGSATGINLNKITGQDDLLANIDNLQDMVKSLGAGNIFSDIIGKAGTLLAGGRMIFPEIWAESSFSRSYSCKMKLVSPSGDKLSVFLNILVPIYHLLALTLPRQSVGQTYFSPFLVRAYSSGLFNVDMGIITDLSVTKGAEGEWTKDGLPTVAEVSFTIKDLYDGMMMSAGKDMGDTNIMSNISELDYIANSCGVNINDHEIGRTIRMYYALNFAGNVKDKMQIGIMGNINQYFNQKLDNIFGVF